MALAGFVAYSTEIERKVNILYSYSLSSYNEIWWSLFLWAFFSIFIVHMLAFAIALATLRHHKFGRFFGVFILLYGTLTSLLSCCITSAIIAYVLYQSKIELFPIHAMLGGFCQLAFYLFMSFFTLKPTL